MNNNFFKKKNEINVHQIMLYQCEEALKAANLLALLMKTMDKGIGEQIEKIENDADEKRNEMIKYVETTYITELDRRDLYSLSRTLDDITDSITGLKDFLIYFDFTPDKTALKCIELIINSIVNISGAMEKWETEDTRQFLAQLKIAEHNEVATKKLFWQTINELGDENNIKEVLIKKEFCRDLISLAEVISKASDKMSDLKIKSLK